MKVLQISKLKRSLRFEGRAFLLFGVKNVWRKHFVLDPIDRATPDPDFPICSSDCWLRVSMHSVGPAIGDLDKGILGFSLFFFYKF